MNRWRVIEERIDQFCFCITIACTGSALVSGYYFVTAFSFLLACYTLISSWRYEEKRERRLLRP